MHGRVRQFCSVYGVILELVSGLETNSRTQMGDQASAYDLATKYAGQFERTRPIIYIPRSPE